MKSLKHLLAMVVVLPIALIAWAQDPVFSQFYASRVYLNPAFTGVQEGIALNIHHRNQWRAIPKKFSTQSVSFESQEPCMSMGWGLTAFKDVEGEGALKTVGGSFVYAYSLRLGDLTMGGKEAESNLHFGIEAGFLQKSIDWQKLHFFDEIDPVYGFTMPSNAQSLPSSDRLNFGDVSVGLLFRQNLYTQRGTRFYRNPLRIAVGGSIKHLLQPAESLYGIETVLPQRLTLHGGVEIPFKEIRIGRASYSRKANFSFLPHFKYEKQGKNAIGTNTIWAYGAYILTPTNIYFGAFHQHSDWSGSREDTKSVVVTFGTEFQTEVMAGALGVSYDYNYLGLGVATAGVLELSLKFRFPEGVVLCNIGALNAGGTEIRGKHGGRTSNKRIMDCNNFF